jgi:hypothetical protein
MRLILQNQSTYSLVFFMADSADHITGKISLSPTVTLSKNGGSFGAAAGAVTEIGGAGNGNGWYKVAGNATDSNTLGTLVLHATAAGADPTDVVFEVTSMDIHTMISQLGDVYTYITSTIAELSQAQPPVNPTLIQAVMLPYMALRNGDAVTTSQRTIKNDAGTVIAKSSLADDGSTLTVGKLATGP